MSELDLEIKNLKISIKQNVNAVDIDRAKLQDRLDSIARKRELLAQLEEEREAQK